jgi:hypothetical protein
VLVTVPGESAERLRESFESEPGVEDRPHCGGDGDVDTGRYRVGMRVTGLDELMV